MLYPKSCYTEPCYEEVNVYCGHLLAVPCGGSASNDYLQHMFHGELKKPKKHSFGHSSILKIDWLTQEQQKYTH